MEQFRNKTAQRIVSVFLVALMIFSMIPVNAFAENVDETTTDQLSEILALIEANADDIDKITSGKINVSDIVNNLTTNVSNKPLSASQGVVLKDLIDTLQIAVNGKSDASHTHEYAGSSTIGGSANSAVKLDSSAGLETQPVYFKDGKPVAITHTLNANVPADAKFTDTIITKTSELINDSVTNEQYPSALAVWNILSILIQYEQIKNKVTSLDENSTDEQYPTAKAVYEGAFSVANKVAEEAEKLENKVTSISSSNTDAQYPSAKATYSAIQTLAEKIANKVTVIDDSASNTTYPSSLAVKNVITEKVDAVIPELEKKIEEGTANVVRTTEDATMQAKFVAQSNSDFTVKQVRNFIISEENPDTTLMADGDFWVKI